MPVAVDVVSASLHMPGLVSETEASTPCQTSVVRSEWVSMGVLHGCTACLFLSTNVRREFSMPMGSKKKVESRKK